MCKFLVPVLLARVQWSWTFDAWPPWPFHAELAGWCPREANADSGSLPIGCLWCSLCLTEGSVALCVTCCTLHTPFCEQQSRHCIQDSETPPIDCGNESSEEILKSKNNGMKCHSLQPWLRAFAVKKWCCCQAISSIARLPMGMLVAANVKWSCCMVGRGKHGPGLSWDAKSSIPCKASSLCLIGTKDKPGLTKDIV